MLEFLKKRFSNKNDQEKIEAEPEEAGQMHPGETPPPPPQKYGLSEDFWPILTKLNFAFGSNEVPSIRASTEYQDILLEYLKKSPENSKDLSHYQTPKYQLLLQSFQQSQQFIKNPTNTSTESLRALPKDTTPTSYRPL